MKRKEENNGRVHTLFWETSLPPIAQFKERIFLFIWMISWLSAIPIRAKLIDKNNEIKNLKTSFGVVVENALQTRFYVKTQIDLGQKVEYNIFLLRLVISLSFQFCVWVRSSADFFTWKKDFIFKFKSSLTGKKKLAHLLYLCCLSVVVESLIIKTEAMKATAIRKMNVAILGAGDSGKSTFLKQISFKYLTDFTGNTQLINNLRDNIIFSAKELMDLAKQKNVYQCDIFLYSVIILNFLGQNSR